MKKTIFAFFPYYLLFIVIAEFAGRIFKYYEMGEMNKFLYSYVVIPVEFLFFFWLFYQSFRKERYKWLPIFCMAIYLASWSIDMLLLTNKKFWFYSFSYTVGNLLLLILIFRFFMQLITTNAILHFRHNMLFWISTGLLVFFLGTFPYYGLLNTLNTKYTSLCIAYGYIVFTLNCLMYLMFTLSFVWGRQNIKSS
ncbi:MAG: hypothetical protein JST82_08390 [Bacteroidetes bacterium]|nr:hypothetical protein [Bacteroidota bacterium]